MLLLVLRLGVLIIDILVDDGSRIGDAVPLPHGTESDRRLAESDRVPAEGVLLRAVGKYPVTGSDAKRGDGLGAGLKSVVDFLSHLTALGEIPDAVDAVCSGGRYADEGVAFGTPSLETDIGRAEVAQETLCVECDHRAASRRIGLLLLDDGINEVVSYVCRQDGVKGFSHFHGT